MWEQRFWVHEARGLRLKVGIGPESRPEGSRVLWEWRYPHDYLGIVEQPWNYLRRTKVDIETVLREHLVGYPDGHVVMYRQNPGAPMAEHSVSTKALLVMVARCAWVRQSTAHKRAAAVGLLLALVHAMFCAVAPMEAGPWPFAVGADGRISGDWWCGCIANVAMYRLWAELQERGFAGVVIGSPIGAPLFPDLLVFLLACRASNNAMWMPGARPSSPVSYIGARGSWSRRCCSGGTVSPHRLERPNCHPRFSHEV